MKITTPADFDSLSYIGAITELEPASGPFASICPPTYAAAGSSWSEKIAMTLEMTIPSRDRDWSDVVRDGDGCPRMAPAVLVNSLGAEAHHLGQILANESGVDWGRIMVKPPDSDVVENLMAETTAKIPVDDTIRDVVREMLSTHKYDSWTASHRFVDASIRYATDPVSGSQVWKKDSSLRGKMQAVDPAHDVDWLWCHAANALICGFWQSITGNGVNPKWARALSSEVFGYGVSLLRTGATKGSELGPVSNEFKTSTDASGELRLGEKRKAVAVGEKPSAFGLGQIATSADFSAVSCEVILRRSGVSLTHLREIKSKSGQEVAIVRAAAAASMFALAGLSKRNVFLRSGTDLFPVSTLWTGRTVDGSKVVLDVDVAQSKQVLAAAMGDLEAAGLPQATIDLTMSPELANLFIASYVSAPKGDGN